MCRIMVERNPFNDEARLHAGSFFNATVDQQMFETTFKRSSKSLSEAKLQDAVILLNCLANDS